MRSPHHPQIKPASERALRLHRAMLARLPAMVANTPGKGVSMTEKPESIEADAHAGGRIRSFVERIETLEQEIADLAEGKKEVFAEAKGEGFDVKVLKEIIKIRKQDRDERDEQEALLDLYLKAMESA